MKIKLFTLLCIVSISASAAVNDYVGTLSKVLGKVHISAGVYYFQSEDLNWGAPSCPNARYAYIAESEPGAKAILSAALTAKVSGTSVSFAGLCGDAGGSDIYLRIKEIHLP